MAQINTVIVEHAYTDMPLQHNMEANRIGENTVSDPSITSRVNEVMRKLNQEVKHACLALDFISMKFEEIKVALRYLGREFVIPIIRKVKEVFTSIEHSLE